MARRPGAYIRLEGDEKIIRKLRKAPDEFRKRAQQRIDASALRIQSDAVRSIQRGPASGMVYEKYMPRRTHQASAPGQPPMTDTGALASSVQIVSHDLAASVGTGLDYGRYLELGTTSILARPWLIPALERDRRRFERDWRGIVDEVARML